jgi:hypothetical protein
MSGSYSNVWWAPNHNSTFCHVPDEELPLFEAKILRPYFAIKLADFGIRRRRG